MSEKLHKRNKRSGMGANQSYKRQTPFMAGASHYFPSKSESLEGGTFSHSEDVSQSPLEAMQRFIQMSDAEHQLLKKPVCVESVQDLRTGPLADYMFSAIQRLTYSRQNLQRKTAAMMAKAEQIHEQAMAMHRVLLRAAQSDRLRSALGHSLQSADAITQMAGHLRNCKKHASNASMYLQLRGGEVPLEGGGAYFGEDVQNASRYAQCAPSLQDLPSAQWFVRAVANHLRSLVVARLALLEAAASLGAARSEALRSSQRLANALNVSKDVAESADWLELEEHVETLRACMADIADLQESIMREQSSALPSDVCITQEDERMAEEEVAMPANWSIVASLSRASADAVDVPRGALVVLANRLGDIAEQRQPEASTMQAEKPEAEKPEAKQPEAESSKAKAEAEQQKPEGSSEEDCGCNVNAANVDELAELEKILERASRE